jgi:hypothetical protein
MIIKFLFLFFRQPTVAELFATSKICNGDATTHSNHEEVVSPPINNNETTAANTPEIPARVSSSSGEPPVEVPEPGLCLLWPRPRFLHPLGGEGVSVPAHLLLVVAAPGSAHQVRGVFLQICGSVSWFRKFTGIWMHLEYRPSAEDVLI